MPTARSASPSAAEVAKRCRSIAGLSLLRYSQSKSTAARTLPLCPEALADADADRQPMSFKPQGCLWLSVGDDWIRWCKSEQYGRYSTYERVKLRSSSTVLAIDSVASLRWFTRAFAATRADDHHPGTLIDWRRVVRAGGPDCRLCGIYLSKEMVDHERLSERFFWKYAWDVGQRGALAARTGRRERGARPGSPAQVQGLLAPAGAIDILTTGEDRPSDSVNRWTLDPGPWKCGSGYTADAAENGTGHRCIGTRPNRSVA